jgi:FixJ family two-component response regulator
MPDIDGMELIQWLADLDMPVQVIVVTGHSSEYVNLAKVLGEGKGLSTVLALTKPIKAKELRDALMDQAAELLEEAE